MYVFMRNENNFVLVFLFLLFFKLLIQLFQFSLQVLVFLIRIKIKIDKKNVLLQLLAIWIVCTYESECEITSIRSFSSFAVARMANSFVISFRLAPSNSFNWVCNSSMWCFLTSIYKVK